MRRTNLSAVIFCLALLFLIVLSAGCSSTRRTTLSKKQSTETQSPDTTALPLLPADIIYMVGVEWLAINDSTTQKYHTDRALQIRQKRITQNQYVDSRLKELYPNIVYDGYTDKMVRIFDLLLQQAKQSSSIRNDIGKELSSVSSANNRYTQETKQRIVGQTEETIEELNRHKRLDSLASGTQWIDNNTLDTLTNPDSEKENLLIALMLRYGPEMFYRVILSKERAECLAKQYYGEDTNSGKRGDAFKHIYVNTLLRNYTGRFMAWVVMDVYWEHAHPNAPCDRYMDTHNNVIGRKTYYNRFITTHQQSSLPSWQQWAENVHVFVEDTTNNSTYQQWNKETPSFIVIENEKRTSNGRYIYWNK